MGTIILNIFIIAIIIRLLGAFSDWSYLSHREKTLRAHDYIFGNPFRPRPHMEEPPQPNLFIAGLAFLLGFKKSNKK